MQQTVEEAMWADSGGKYPAAKLLALSAEDLALLRRKVMRSITLSRRGKGDAVLVCAICGTPVFVSRQHREAGNRWFTHLGHPTECPWYEGKKLTPEQWNAYRYHGQQESKAHKFLKHFIADWLERDPRVPFVNRDKVTLGEVRKGEWKRPDVRCELDGKRLVFEIQLSYTFLSEVIKRDDFYRDERTHVIWIFREFDISRASHQDEVFYNRRNLFVMDDEAIAKTAASERLYLKCFFPVSDAPTTSLGGWQSALVTLDDLKFPEDNYRPYFADFVREAEDRARVELVQAATTFIQAALVFYESDYAEAHSAQIEVAGLTLARLGYQEALDKNFWGHHRVLPKLLSIKMNRGVGYDYPTAYEVLNAALQPSAESARRFASLYEAALNAFQPAMSERRAARIKDAIAKAKTLSPPDTTFDALAFLLFPELAGTHHDRSVSID